MRARIAARLAAVVLFSSLASVSAAQPAEFGIQDGNDLWIPASQFTGTAGWVEGTIGYGYFYATAVSTFHAGLPLPQGAYIDSWRAFYYDNSASDDFTVSFLKWFDDTTAAPTPGAVLIHEFTSTGSPGLTSYEQAEGFTIDLRQPLQPSVTRAAAADFYTFYVVMPANQQVQFKGIRVIWHRQVSLAPATATFNDVPTSDPAFQYIEALAASGITSGCGSGNYCPDANLTRRQMAVFLSKALGLHWPNF